MFVTQSPLESQTRIAAYWDKPWTMIKLRSQLEDKIGKWGRLTLIFAFMEL